MKTSEMPRVDPFEETLKHAGWGGVITEVATAVDRKHYQLAKMFGVTTVTMSRWVHNRSEPRPQHREKLELLHRKFVKGA